MLELRPSCEQCNTALPPDSTEARICSFECTYCVRCVEEVLEDVCPRCGGGFAPRPVRPARNWRAGNYLGMHPAITEITYQPVDPTEHARFAATIRAIPPEER